MATNEYIEIRTSSKLSNTLEGFKQSKFAINYYNQYAPEEYNGIYFDTPLHIEYTDPNTGSVSYIDNYTYIPFGAEKMFQSHPIVVDENDLNLGNRIFGIPLLFERIGDGSVAEINIRHPLSVLVGYTSYNSASNEITLSLDESINANYQYTVDDRVVISFKTPNISTFTGIDGQEYQLQYSFTELDGYIKSITDTSVVVEFIEPVADTSIFSDVDLIAPYGQEMSALPLGTIKSGISSFNLRPLNYEIGDWTYYMNHRTSPLQTRVNTFIVGLPKVGDSFKMMLNIRRKPEYSNFITGFRIIPTVYI